MGGSGKFRRVYSGRRLFFGNGLCPDLDIPLILMQTVHFLMDENSIERGKAQSGRLGRQNTNVTTPSTNHPRGEDKGVPIQKEKSVPPKEGKGVNIQ